MFMMALGGSQMQYDCIWSMHGVFPTAPWPLTKAWPFRTNPPPHGALGALTTRQLLLELWFPVSVPTTFTVSVWCLIFFTFRKFKGQCLTRVAFWWNPCSGPIHCVLWSLSGVFAFNLALILFQFEKCLCWYLRCLHIWSLRSLTM